MAYRDMTKTMFGDVAALPIEVYRVQTESSTYTVSIHEERGRKYALVRGEAGTDREAVVVRDSDPRIGERSLFEVHYLEWIGQPLDVASMRTSPITKATRVVIGAAPPELAGAHVPAPPGMSESPRIMPMPGRGTAIGDAHQPRFAQGVVAPNNTVALPYPVRHVRYAEDVATLLRSIHRRDRLFEDVSGDRAMRDRLFNALDAAEKLLAEIRKRAK